MSAVRRLLREEFTTTARQREFLLGSYIYEWSNAVRNANLSFLPGDSGFPLEPWLMVPFHNPEDGTREARFNKKHARARQVVERCFGVLKGRFRCLNKERILHYSPQKAGLIMYAVFTLHNICIRNNLYDDLSDVDNRNREDEDNNDDEVQEERGQWRVMGSTVRTAYINQNAI